MEAEKKVEEQKVVVPHHVLNDIVNYLATKPFAEVAKLINALGTHAKPVEAPKAAAERPPAN